MSQHLRITASSIHYTNFNDDGLASLHSSSLDPKMTRIQACLTEKPQSTAWIVISRTSKAVELFHLAVMTRRTDAVNRRFLLHKLHDLSTNEYNNEQMCGKLGN